MKLLKKILLYPVYWISSAFFLMTEATTISGVMRFRGGWHDLLQLLCIPAAWAIIAFARAACLTDGVS